MVAAAIVQVGSRLIRAPKNLLASALGYALHTGVCVQIHGWKIVSVCLIVAVRSCKRYS
jgi:hypothetical protein